MGTTAAPPAFSTLNLSAAVCAQWTATFEPVEMYIWLDGPRTFTLLDEDGHLRLAHWLQQVGPLWQYVVVPVTASILGELNSGQQTLADVLKQPRVYPVSVRPDFTVEQVSLIAWESLPKDALPAAGH